MYIANMCSLETQHTIGYGGRQTTEECPEAIAVMSFQVTSNMIFEIFDIVNIDIIDILINKVNINTFNTSFRYALKANWPYRKQVVKLLKIKLSRRGQKAIAVKRLTRP